MEQLTENREGSRADGPAVVQDQTPKRSERRHAVSDDLAERAVLLVLVLFALFGGAHAFVEVMTAVAPREAPSYSEPPNLVEVPNLVGATSLGAARGMAGEGFAVEDVLVESAEAVGTVVSQDPKAGKTTGEGATIHVRISGRQVDALPDVQGKTFEEAEQSIAARPFELDVRYEESPTRDRDVVLRQEPAGGDGVTAEAGTRVTLTVGKGPAPKEEAPKDIYAPGAAGQPLGAPPGTSNSAPPPGQTAAVPPPPPSPPPSPPPPPSPSGVAYAPTVPKNAVWPAPEAEAAPDSEWDTGVEEDDMTLDDAAATEPLSEESGW